MRITYLHLLLGAALLLLPFGKTVQAQQIALKTNALFLAACTPNLETELVAGEHTSISLGVFGHKNPYGKESKLIGVQPEYRYWFNGRPMIREYIGAALLWTSYQMHLGHKWYDGDAYGAGITMGYVLSLGKRLNLEFYGGFGIMAFKQKFYYENDRYEEMYPDGNLQANDKGYKLLPTKLGVSISYIIK